MYDLQSQWRDNHQTEHELSKMVEANDRDLDIEHDHYGFGVPTHLAWELDRADQLHAEN